MDNRDNLDHLRVVEQRVQNLMRTDEATLPGKTISRVRLYQEYTVLGFTDNTFCVLVGLSQSGVAMQIVQQSPHLHEDMLHKTGAITGAFAEQLRTERNTIELMLRRLRDKDQVRQLVRDYGYDAVHQMLQEVQ